MKGLGVLGAMTMLPGTTIPTEQVDATEFKDDEFWHLTTSINIPTFTFAGEKKPVEKQGGPAILTMCGTHILRNGLYNNYFQKGDPGMAMIYTWSGIISGKNIDKARHLIFNIGKDEAIGWAKDLSQCCHKTSYGSCECKTRAINPGSQHFLKGEFGIYENPFSPSGDTQQPEPIFYDIPNICRITLIAVHFQVLKGYDAEKDNNTIPRK